MKSDATVTDSRVSLLPLSADYLNAFAENLVTVA